MPIDLLAKKPETRSPIPQEILDRSTTLVEALTALAKGFPEQRHLAILDRNRDEVTVSFGELWDRARRIQTTMARRGLEAGGVALLALPTSADLVAGFFAAILQGARPAIIATPSHRYADPGVYGQLIASLLPVGEPQVLFCSDDVAAICRAADGPAMGGTAVVTAAEVEVEAALADVAVPSPDDIAMVQYSSGSTGSPKGVLLTHRAVLNNMRATRDGLGLSAADVGVNWIPLYHDMGLIEAFLLPLLGGSPTVLIPTGDFLRDPSLWLWAIHHYGGSYTLAPNFAFTLCAGKLADSALRGLDLSTLRIAVNGSEPVLSSTITAFTERFSAYGFRPDAMCPAWGLAEAVCIVTVLPPGVAPIVHSIDRAWLAERDVANPVEAGEGMDCVSVGPPLPGCEVEIRDDGGHVLGDAHVGRVWTRNTSLMKGYQNAPDLTAAVLVDGWLDTGDRGYLDGGHFYFVSREKDLIVIGGEKYAPHDLETALNDVPGARPGCAVAFGVTNSERGTEDVAVVVETGVETEEERAALRDSVRDAVMRRTGIGLRAVILVPSGGIEKTTSGKLARAATAERYADRVETGGQW